MPDRIHVLSEIVANQIAAGEVIERPASVVKELVENAVDAQASRLQIDIERGGKTLICVSDNGVGMSRRDALLSLERHATSKVKEAADLLSIRSYGFRGEALPSIASVSDFRLRTCEAGADVGTEIVVQGGKVLEVKDAQAAPGTMIEVRSLFSALPARRKFLRSDGTEWSHIEQLVKTLALSQPSLSLSVRHQDTLVYQFAAARDLNERLCAVFGSQWWEQVKPVEFEASFMRVSGVVGDVGVSRIDRGEQFIFVNGRAVQNSTLNFALLEGYGQALLRGRYPLAVLFLEVPPAKVDVNVHPAKREVRFHDPAAVRQLISTAVSRALRQPLVLTLSGNSQADPLPASAFDAQLSAEAAAASPSPISQAQLASARRGCIPIPRPRKKLETRALETFGGEPFAGALELIRGEAIGAKVDAVPMHALHILGSVLNRYIVAEHPQGLVLIDQRAAHERVLFEQFTQNSQSHVSQALLLPITFTLSSLQSDFLQHHVALFTRLGIGLGELGGNSWIVDTLPPQLAELDIKEFFQLLLADLEEGQTPLSAYQKFTERLIIEKICRRAVQHDRCLNAEEIDKLLADLYACQSPYTDPTARPTMLLFSRSELEKKFGKKS